MVYIVKKVVLNNNATVTEGKRLQTIVYPHELEIGGLYFLRPGKLYRVISRESKD